MTEFKICGVTDPADAAAAILAGAGYLGFVFHAPSPRNLDLPSAAALAGAVPDEITRVALTVDMSDAGIGAILASVPIDMIQLHGGESPDRVAAVRDRFGLPVMKALGVADPRDLDRINSYSGVADRILLDAKPQDGALPGGNGIAFDWQMIASRRWETPWMLAGGLAPENVAEAVRLTHAPAVDVSSGVESAPGIKDPRKIARFGEAVRGA